MSHPGTTGSDHILGSFALVIIKLLYDQVSFRLRFNTGIVTLRIRIALSIHRECRDVFTALVVWCPASFNREFKYDARPYQNTENPAPSELVRLFQAIWLGIREVAKLLAFSIWMCMADVGYKVGLCVKEIRNAMFVVWMKIVNIFIRAVWYKRKFYFVFGQHKFINLFKQHHILHSLPDIYIYFSTLDILN